MAIGCLFCSLLQWIHGGIFSSFVLATLDLCCFVPWLGGEEGKVGKRGVGHECGKWESVLNLERGKALGFGVAR